MRHVKIMAARLHNVSQDDATRSTGVLGHRRQQHLRHSRPTSDRRQALDDSWLERSSICGVTRRAPTASSVFVEDVRRRWRLCWWVREALDADAPDTHRTRGCLASRRVSHLSPRIRGYTAWLHPRVDSRVDVSWGMLRRLTQWTMLAASADVMNPRRTPP